MTSPNVPPPADAPDDGYNATWEPETYPDTIAGVVESRTTHKFRSPRSERETFEKLVILAGDELVDVLGGRARLARLITKHDPRPGDGISITAFGSDEKGWHRYGMTVDKSARIGYGREEGSVPVHDPMPFGDEEGS